MSQGSSSRSAQPTGTIPSLYALLKTEWNIRPEETFVGAGPSLGFECAEFSNPKNELPSVPSSLVRGKLVDLQGAADRELDRLGVPREQRERLPDCTKCHPETYWTYRGGDREAVKEGWTNVLMALLL
ncbi:laccase domain-containing protein [Candidatus Peregrinibacteria bacterium]|nr:laccase domain-containing protein [Candidatus Peregrinibacteria bacterium]